jgi:hypothetical protein
LHDIATLDKRGIPGCGVASEEFKPGAVAQSKSLGFRPAMIWVPHPIQNRTPEELVGLAGAAMPEIVAAIQG